MKVFPLESSVNIKTRLKRQPSQEKPIVLLILLLLPLRQTEHSLRKVVIFRGCIYFGVYGRFSTPQGSILRFYRLSSRNILLLLNIQFWREKYEVKKREDSQCCKRKDLFRQVRIFSFCKNKNVNLKIIYFAQLLDN